MITDVRGIRVGHAGDPVALTGCTVVLCDAPAVCAVERRGSANDVVLQALNGTAYVGSHYLGGSYPPALHTWSVRAPENAVLTVTYHSADENPPQLRFVALKAAHLLTVSREGKGTIFTMRLIGPEGIFAVTCPSGAFSVDAMHVRVKP